MTSAEKKLAGEAVRSRNIHTFTELAVDLATQDVEQVRRSGHVNNLHVDILVLALEPVLGREHTRLLVTELQPPLHSAGRVLRALAIITVRQRQNQARALEPLGFSSGNELIDDALSVVGEVTELCLPHHESIRGSQRVSVFETKAVKFGVSSTLRNLIAHTYAPYSLRDELEMTKLPCLSLMCCSGTYVLSVAWSCKTE